jgi:hypothetical protein
VRVRFLLIIIVALGLAAEGPAILAQGKKRRAKPKSQPSKNNPGDRPTLEGETEKYKAELRTLIAFREENVRKAASQLERLKEAFDLGLISKREVEKAEQDLAKARDEEGVDRKRMEEADHVFAEIKALDQLAKMRPVRLGGYSVTYGLIRYNGPAAWFLTDAAKVQGFFSQRFGRALPISAFGQTATHDRLGFDHRNAIDVAVHPDSAEGQSLMAYLRGIGIPFIAFRQAVAGSATGPHIHIGQPSRRIR